MKVAITAERQPERLSNPSVFSKAFAAEQTFRLAVSLWRSARGGSQACVHSSIGIRKDRVVLRQGDGFVTYRESPSFFV